MSRIAFVDPFPNLVNTAELEFIARFRNVAEKSGHIVHRVVTSDDIHRCKPDLVLVAHEFSPKLTPYLTLGFVWSPPSFWINDKDRLRAIWSWDGHLCGSAVAEKCLRDLEFSLEIERPKANFLFPPAAPSRPFRPRRTTEPRDIAYVSASWDGQRHKGLLAGLEQAGVLNIYGPRQSWPDKPHAYRGDIPYNGEAIFSTLSGHGIALCLHKEDHRLANMPSMRLFEAAAAGCVIIADDLPFARSLLGNDAFYLDLSEDDASLCEKVVGFTRWTNQNQGKANQMAKASNEIVGKAFGLELLVERAVEFSEVVRRQGRTKRARAVDQTILTKDPRQPPEGTLSPTPHVDIILRAGGRPVELVRRALRSIVAQEAGRYRVLLVDYKGRKDLQDLASEDYAQNVAVSYLRSADTGLRSTATWTGFRAVAAPFFALLDDDDELMPSHFSSLLELAQRNPDVSFFYTGVVRVEESEGCFMDRPNFNGPLHDIIEERRELKFNDPFDLNRLVQFDNYIQSNTWIARSTLLCERLLQDPEMEVAEDMYFYLLVAEKTRFLSTMSPSAYWNWRISQNDNSMTSVNRQDWNVAVSTMMRRLRQSVFFPGLSLQEAVDKRGA